MDDCCGTVVAAIDLHKFIELFDGDLDVGNPIGQVNSLIGHGLGVSLEKVIVAPNVSQRGSNNPLILRILHKLLVLQSTLSEGTVEFPRWNAWLEGKRHECRVGPVFILTYP